MSVDAIVHTEFPKGYTVLFGADGKVIMTPQSFEHSSTIKSDAMRRPPPTSTSTSPPTRTPPRIS
jgi:hypothetical protein